MHFIFQEHDWAHKIEVLFLNRAFFSLKKDWGKQKGKRREEGSNGGMKLLACQRTRPTEKRLWRMGELVHMENITFFLA